ncbi:MAG: hypothetical protein ACRCX8_01480 [Sarcina sp.]
MKEGLERGFVKNVIVDRPKKSSLHNRYRISIPSVLAESIGLSEEDKAVRVLEENGRIVIEKIK